MPEPPEQIYPREQERARLRRALLMQCPMCGYAPVTHSFGEIVETCEGCGFDFERGESGYYVGAMIMSMAVCLLSFLVIFGVSLLVTWPDVPWTLVTWIAVAAMVIIPIWFYPRSKTIWIWADHRINPRWSE
ncbi:DUF983 domain-containing protein [Euzebya tangerina]|uniref:DUF983 domain-containing protein n=1 Tax=Euzebya tangerina TaxID=591198 RepID=UPI000E319425|nr:DUF983 domain-containing protein [Euzebya tangerina]